MLLQINVQRYRELHTQSTKDMSKEIIQPFRTLNDQTSTVFCILTDKTPALAIDFPAPYRSDKAARTSVETRDISLSRLPDQS